VVHVPLSGHLVTLARGYCSTFKEVMMRVLSVLAMGVTLVGCAFNVTMMPRDSGGVYTGHIEGIGGAGTMTMAMGPAICTGPVVKVASGAIFGFANTFGTVAGRSFRGTTTATTSGDSHLKALLSCGNGSGLRCDLTSTGGAGGGICVDDTGRVYDAVVTRK
jgi:hypothetical protein